MRATLIFPSLPLVNNDTDGQITNRTDVVFGMRSSRTATSTRAATGLGDLHRMLHSGQGDDPSTLGLAVTASAALGNQAGNIIAGYSDVFTMDNIVSGAAAFTYTSGSRTGETSYTAGAGRDYRSLIDLGYDSFAAPFFGGFDGFDILYLIRWLTLRLLQPEQGKQLRVQDCAQALETLADPELLDFNVLAVPGLTRGFNNQMDLCQERRDALAVIDLPMFTRLLQSNMWLTKS